MRSGTCGSPVAAAGEVAARVLVVTSLRVSADRVVVTSGSLLPLLAADNPTYVYVCKQVCVSSRATATSWHGSPSVTTVARLSRRPSNDWPSSTSRPPLWHACPMRIWRIIRTSSANLPKPKARSPNDQPPPTVASLVGQLRSTSRTRTGWAQAGHSDIDLIRVCAAERSHHRHPMHHNRSRASASAPSGELE